MGARAVWRNWAGNQKAHPASITHPATEGELAAVVTTAAEAGHVVRVAGSGHSFTDTVVTDGHLVILDRYDAVLDVDTAAMTVTVQAGIPLHALNEALLARGLALPNLGDIDRQTIAGATSTGTHGTGVGFQGIASQIVGMRLIVGDGSVLACDAEREHEVFHCARVGLGALGVVSTITLAVVPAFNLHASEAPKRIDEVLDGLDDLVAGNDHYELYWVPHTGWALTKANNRVTDQGPNRPRWKELWEDEVLGNGAFGLACRVGRARPSLIPRLMKAIPSTGPVDYVDVSYKVFTSPRRVKFQEMEYSVPRAAGADCLRAIRKLVGDLGAPLSFPVEMRFLGADDIPLSTAYGSERCYLAVHTYQGTDNEAYFAGVEAIMRDHEGRPHWGKLHGRTAADLAPCYPEWDRFQAARQRLDPDGRFLNAYTRRVLVG